PAGTPSPARARAPRRRSATPCSGAGAPAWSTCYRALWSFVAQEGSQGVTPLEPMLCERWDLPARGRFAPRRREEEQFEFGAELRIARDLALRERFVDLAVEGVIRVQYEHKLVPDGRKGEERRVFHRVLDDAVAVRLVRAIP